MLCNHVQPERVLSGSTTLFQLLSLGSPGDNLCQAVAIRDLRVKKMQGAGGL